MGPKEADASLKWKPGCGCNHHERQRLGNPEHALANKNAGPRLRSIGKQGGKDHDVGPVRHGLRLVQ